MRLRITTVVRVSRPSSHCSSRQRLGGPRATRIGGHDRTRWKSLQAKTASSLKLRHIPKLNNVANVTPIVLGLIGRLNESEVVTELRPAEALGSRPPRIPDGAIGRTRRDRDRHPC